MSRALVLGAVLMTVIAGRIAFEGGILALRLDHDTRLAEVERTYHVIHCDSSQDDSTQAVEGFIERGAAL